MRLPGRRSDGRTPGAHPTRRAVTGTARPRGRLPRAGSALGGPAIRLPRRRRLPRLTPARAGAILGILAALGGIYGLAATPAFPYSRVEIPSLRWTARQDVEAAIAIPAGANLFQVRTGPIEDRIRVLPGVADASVSVSLPDTLVVDVTERTAILAWVVGEQRFLVDHEGVLFARAAPGAAAAAGLPVIDDARVASATLAVGARLDPVDLDAARRIGSLNPDDVGSVAESLLVTVSDASGFVVGTRPASWIAVFGLYTASRRTPDMVPAQVRLLRSLLDGREGAVAQVFLPDGDAGTFIAKPTPGAVGP
ncbi:MAG: FtsQ-type POTRA domain-containing protein [Chloroflexi bacterium]|nr:FtsQ-type POTRA domain-containing protein [Chloroflexota bacterium]